MTKVSPWVTVGVLVALVAGAAALSVVRAPFLLPNDPAAATALRDAVNRTLAFNNFTAVDTTESSFSKIVYQRPNWFALYSRSSPSPFAVENGSTTYVYGPSVPGCSPGWIPFPEMYFHLDALEFLTTLRNLHYHVQETVASQFQVETVESLTTGPIHVVVRSTAAVIASDGHVISEQSASTVTNESSLVSIQGRILSGQVHLFDFDSSPPVTAPPSSELRTITRNTKSRCLVEAIDSLPGFN